MAFELDMCVVIVVSHETILGFFRKKNLADNRKYHNPALISVLFALENLEHCGGEPEQADTGYYVTDGRHVNHPGSPTCTSIYHSQGL